MNSLIKSVVRAFKEAFKCYAGSLHLMRGGNKGYAPFFEQVTKFPGRMAAMAKAADLTGIRRPGKEWLNGLPRLIFISDMGDALSEGIDFPFLKEEIIDVVSGQAGRRHLWLWLTKRPQRMAEFSDWLIGQNIAWPDNLVAMTSVTSKATCSRIAQLKRVKSRFKGLSVEPLWEAIMPDLDGIDWCIVGGESGPNAAHFDLACARSLRDQCQEAGTAFFMKQLGAAPIEHGNRLTIRDTHGGDWHEWPHDLKVRSFPDAFYTLPCSDNYLLSNFSQVSGKEPSLLCRSANDSRYANTVTLKKTSILSNKGGMPFRTNAKLKKL